MKKTDFKPQRYRKVRAENKRLGKGVVRGNKGL